MTQLHILQHSLGLDQYGHGGGHRNYFVTGPGSTDYTDCVSLVAQGFMTQTPGNAITGGDDVFRVTAAGKAYIEVASPRRPPEPKRTRSQKRYRDWQHSDIDCTFAEWIGVRA